jgi:hypothetical protein
LLHSSFPVQEKAVMRRNGITGRKKLLKVTHPLPGILIGLKSFIAQYTRFPGYNTQKNEELKYYGFLIHSI